MQFQGLFEIYGQTKLNSITEKIQHKKIHKEYNQKIKYSFPGHVLTF